MYKYITNLPFQTHEKMQNLILHHLSICKVLIIDETNKLLPQPQALLVTHVITSQNDKMKDHSYHRDTCRHTKTPQTDDNVQAKSLFVEEQLKFCHRCLAHFKKRRTEGFLYFINSIFNIEADNFVEVLT